MKRRAAWLVLLLLLVPCVALAGAEGTRGYLTEPPREVLDHIARSFAGYTMEDYCEIYDTPEGDFSFALLKAGDERLLVGYEEKDGKMELYARVQELAARFRERNGSIVCRELLGLSENQEKTPPHAYGFEYPARRSESSLSRRRAWVSSPPAIFLYVA